MFVFFSLHGHRSLPAPPWRRSLWSHFNSPTQTAFIFKSSFWASGAPPQRIKHAFRADSFPIHYPGISSRGRLSPFSTGCHGNWRNGFSCMSGCLLDIWYLSCWLCNRALSVPTHQLSTALSSQHDNATHTHTHTLTAAAAFARTCPTESRVCCWAAGTVFGNT